VMHDEEGPWTDRAGPNFARAFVAVRYVYKSDQMLVRIASSWERRGTEWSRYHYAYHCGPDRYDEETRTHFRVDLDDVRGHHVHLPPVPGQPHHIPVDQVEPDVKNIDPLAFVDLVASFRRTKEIPLKRKK
jgi:hypothetical protein